VNNTITLETIGGGQPDQMILPLGASYPDANNGITGDKNPGQFNPFVDGPATFTLALSGVTANTTLSSVSFSFGTSPDTFLSGLIIPPRPPVEVPEPPTLALMGAVLLIVFGVRRFRRA
jgi:hypothetical protein